MVQLISAALQSCKTAQVFYVVANMLSTAAFQETQRVWLENTVATPCTRCWVTSAWWDSWGFTHCLVIITRPSKCWRTLSSTRRYGFVEKRRWFSCVCFWWILFTLTWCKAESSYSFSCLVHTHTHTVPVLFFCLSEYVLTCAWVPDHHVLLCGVCLFDDEALSGRHSSLCQHPAVHPEDQKHVPEVNI